MIEIPSPSDVVLKFLVSLGTPALVLLPIALAIAIREWLSGIETTLSTAGTVIDSAGSFAKENLYFRTGLFYLSGVLVPALAPIATSFILMWVFPPPLKSPEEYQFSELLVILLNIPLPYDIRNSAFLISLGWVLMELISRLFRWEFMFGISGLMGMAVAAIFGLAFILCAAVFSLLALVFVGNLILGIGQHSLGDWIMSASEPLPGMVFSGIPMLLLGGFVASIYGVMILPPAPWEQFNHDF